MKYLYIDGDNIGLKIEQSFFNNDEAELASINLKVINAISDISKYLIENNHKIIFAGADGIISKGEEIDVKSLLEFTRNLNNEITFSIGISNNLKNCYTSLRYAKSYGKNIAVDYSGKNKFKIIQ
jgi:hypothetical protein